MRPEQPLSSPVRVEAPAAAPVSLDDLKRHLRNDCFDDDDQLLQGLIDGAVSHFDGYSGILGRALVTQTWRQDFPAFAHCLRLPLGPLVGAPVVTYFDANNVLQILADTVYAAHTDARGPFLRLNTGQTWPATACRLDAVSVEFVAGEDPAKVPDAIKVAIMLLVAHWYNNPEAVAAGGKAELPFAVSALVAPLRRVGV